MQRVTTAKLLLINDKNEALMLRISEYEAHPEKSHTPDLPGGLVDPNESERAAVVRELQEEAGITIDPNLVTLGYARTELYPDKDESVTKLLYVARIDETPPVTISWEHEAYEWCALETFLETYTFRPFYGEAIAYLLDNQLV